MSTFQENNIFITEEQIRLELLRQDVEEVDSEDDDATLSNNDVDDDEFLLNIKDEEEYCDPLQRDSDPEGKERSFVLGKDGETIWTTSTLKSRTSRTPKRNIVTHLPGARGEGRTCKTPIFFLELFISNDIIQKIVTHTNEEIKKR